MEMISEGIETLHEGGLKKLLRETKRAVPRRALGRKTFLPYHIHFELHTRKNSILNEYLYKAPPDLYRPIQVDPTSISFEATSIKERDGIGQINAGNWDKESNLKPIGKNPIVKGLKQRFEEQKQWEETAYYAARRDEYGSAEEFLQIRCAFVEELYRSIKEDGYRPNYKAGHRAPDKDKKRTRDGRYKHKLEPLVAIGRKGEIYWSDGFHRLAVTRILNVSSIPVQVIARHQQWQQVREKVHSTVQNEKAQSLSDDLLSHPDLQEFYY